MSSNDSKVLEIVEAVSQSLQDHEIIQIPFEPTTNQERIQAEREESQVPPQQKKSINGINGTNHQSHSKPKPKKLKKLILYRCKICKTTGKKSTVKMCSKCKFHFHIECLDPEKLPDQSKPFVCEICENSTSEPIRIKHQEKQTPTVSKKEQNPAQKEKCSSGFLNISKLMNVYRANFKKQEWKRKLYEFYKNYPYCFQKKRVVFPIQDHLLHIYQSIFPSYCKTTSARPKPFYQSKIIPKVYFNDLFEIEVFFANFWQDLKNYKFFMPNEALKANKLNLSDLKRQKIYEKLLPEGMTELYVDLLQMLLRIYLNDIMDRSRIDNMKYISSNAFFNLLATINEAEGRLSKEFVIKAAPEILKNLIKIPSFRRSFFCQFDGQELHQLHYPKKLTFKNKLEVITKLLRGLCDTDSFKELVMKKSEQISLFTKEKGETMQTLKQIETENIPIRQKIKQLQQEIKQLAFSDPKQYSKKYESSTKKLEKLINQHKANVDKVAELKERVKVITGKVPFVNSVMKYLGVDRFKSEYFFYNKEPNRLYVKYRESFLEGSLEEDAEGEKALMVYEGKEQIDALKNWLNAKGVNEKGVLFNLNSLEQKQVLYRSENEAVNQEVQIQTISLVEERRLTQLQSITREQTLQALIFCQNLFKETFLSQQALNEREPVMIELFERLNFDECYSKSSKGVDGKSSQASESNHEKDQHVLRILFSKYPMKLWNWNEKVKKFWMEFLDMYIEDPHYRTETNLMILVEVFKVSMRLYYGEAMKKKEKVERKKQKEKKQLGSENQLSSEQQNMMNISPSERQDENEEGMPTRKRHLRKREMPVTFKQEESQLQEQGSSSKKEVESEEEKVKPGRKKRKMEESQQQIIQENKPKRGRPRKDQKNSDEQKLSSSDQPVSKRTSLKNSSDQLKPSSFQSVSRRNVSKKLSIQSASQSQQSLKPSPQQSVNSQQQQEQVGESEQQQSESSPQEVFCQECFENINYDQSAKPRIVRCGGCEKVYHRRCLEKEDAERYKKKEEGWMCAECNIQRKDAVKQRKDEKPQRQKQSITKNTDDDKRRSVKVDQKEMKIVFQTVKLSKTSSKTDSNSAKPSKLTQKSQKKSRKKAITQQQSPQAQLQSQNSESIDSQQANPKGKKTPKQQKPNKRDRRQKSDKKSKSSSKSRARKNGSGDANQTKKSKRAVKKSRKDQQQEAQEQSIINSEEEDEYQVEQDISV